MKSVSSVVVGSLVIALAGCNPFAPDQSVVLGVSQLDAPTAISSSDNLPVALTVTVGGCLSFDRIEVTRDLSGASFTAWGRDASKGRKDVMCPADVRAELHSYTLVPPFANPFSIQVQRGRLSPLTTTVQVK